MKLLNQKSIRSLFIISVILNIALIGFYILRLSGKDERKEASEEIAKVAETRPAPAFQPKKVSYYLGRNEVFEKLPNDPDEIVLVGNSLTHNYEWNEIFRNVNIKNRGIGSDITRGVIQRLDEIVESKPLKIFLEIGINDIARGYSNDSIFINYLEIIETIQEKSPATKIYVQSVLPCQAMRHNSIIDLNSRLKDFCSRNKLIYIDLHSRFVSGEVLNPAFDCGDNVHLNGNGYLLWCKLIRDYVYE
jgi:lysophospholipase L1-like esterase